MKPKYQNQKKEYDKLNKRLKDYSDRSELLLGSLNEEVAASISTLDIDEDVFRFKDYTQLNQTSDSIRNAFITGLWGLISSGIDTEWANADSNAQKLISNASSVYSEDFIGKYNELASDAFKKRNAGGLTISQRIWRRYYDYRDFLEASISASIRKGMNAGEVKREITNDLQNIDALRVKYKDRYGSVPNIKDVRYYVSRLVTSEINMAYRECEQQRWRQLDFVLGFKINLSGAHKERDICDDLAGVYPKSFKWYGWHPLDRCYMTPVLMSDMEFWEWNNGGKKSGEITDVPQNFKRWVDDNADKINASSSPYFFITDNWNGRLKDYARYKTDSNYRDVAFDYVSGGLQASHRGHNFDKKGGQYELNVQYAGFRSGHIIVLEDERFASKKNGSKFTEGTWDGFWFEVAGRETATSNNILRGLKHCASKKKTKYAVLDFPFGGFDAEVLENAIKRYRGLEKLQDGQFVKFDKIICVQDRRIVYYKDF